MQEFNVVVEAPSLAAYDADLVDDFLDVLVVLAGDASVTATDDRVTARIDVAVATGLITDASKAAVGIFIDSIGEVGFPAGDIDAVEVRTIERFAAEIDEPAETYAGVAEVAEMLHVSRQRISELRMTKGFPAPLAELASGPVWAVSTLSSFTDTWERRPGRPRKASSNAGGS